MEKPLKEYISSLDKKFFKNKKIPLEKLIEPSKRGSMIPKGTLVVMPFVSGEIRLKILEKATPDRGFSIPLILSNKGEGQSITADYLVWFLKHNFVNKYLMNYASGSVLPRVPRRFLLNLLIPLPIQKRKKPAFDSSFSSGFDSIFANAENPFRNMMTKYFRDYQFNLEKERYTAAIILAGAISEAILYQLLIDNDVDIKILSEDRNLGLGKLITYVRLLKLDKILNFPLTHFSELQHYRNSAVHFNLATNNEKLFTRQNLECFDQIIRHFGI
jgi:hypothetical protein